MITAIKYDCYILSMITAKQGSYCERSMAGMILSSLEFFIVKICNFVAVRFYFGFQKILGIDRLAVKLSFIFDFILLELYFSNKSSS